MSRKSVNWDGMVNEKGLPVFVVWKLKEKTLSHFSKDLSINERLSSEGTLGPVSREAPSVGTEKSPEASEASPSQVPWLRIRPSGRCPTLNIGELWSYRGLFFFLVWRDIKVRYAQTVLGAGWAILQPVLTMLIFTLIFGILLEVPSDGVPYPPFALAALVPWTYFSTAMNKASNSLVMNNKLVTKIYFPRLVIPSAPVLAGLVDFAIAFVILLLMILGYGMWPSGWELLLLPVLSIVMVLTVAGVGCWLSALNIQYRDIKHITPFLVQIWMYSSPIVYPMSKVPDRFLPIYALNPMAGVIEGFRTILLGTNAVPWSMISISLVTGMLIFISGVFYFRWSERVFADVA